MSDILKRLLCYSPPDRTIDDQRQIAQDIQDAAGEIEKQGATISRLEQEVERLKNENEIYSVNDKNQREGYLRLREERKRDALDGQAALDEANNAIADLRFRLAEAEGKVEKAFKIASMRSKYPATMTNYYLEHIEEIEQILRGEP